MSNIKKTLGDIVHQAVMGSTREKAGLFEQAVTKIIGVATNAHGMALFAFKNEIDPTQGHEFEGQPKSAWPKNVRNKEM